MVEILNVVDMGTSVVVAAHGHANFHAQTALEAIAEVLLQQGKPACITLDRDPRWVGVRRVGAYGIPAKCGRG